MDEKGVIATEECVEAELVHEGGSEPRHKSEHIYNAPPPLPPSGILTRLKRFIGGGLAVLALTLLIIGALLTSTVIGAILGIPLMLAGAALLALFFKLFASELRNFVVFRKFP